MDRRANPIHGEDKMEEEEQGPRVRALTERGAQYQSSTMTKELNSASRSLSRLLDRVDAAIADGVAVEQARRLRDEAMAKSDQLTTLYQRIVDCDTGPIDIDTRVFDRVSDRYSLAMQEVNRFLLDQRLETQSSASSRSGMSRRSEIRTPTGEASANAAIERLTDALSRVSTQRLPIPEPDIFDGDRFSFTLWLQSFEAIVESQVSDKADCLFYLNRYLRGEPKDMVKGLLPLRRSEAYWKAKQMLVRRYGDPYTAFDAYRQRLYSWPRITANDGSGLQKFSDFLEHCLEASSLIPALKSFDDPRENQRLLRKLPTHLASKWASLVDDWRERTEAGDGRRDEESPVYGYPGFAEFVSFVRKQARIACDPITSVCALKESAENTSYVAKRVSKSTFLTRTVEPDRSPLIHRRVEQRSYAVTGEQVEANPVCGVCEGRHSTTKCKRLLATPAERRERLVKENGLCFRCLRRGHIGRDCRSSSRCECCGGLHATVLHHEGRKSATVNREVASLARVKAESVVANTAQVEGVSKNVSHSLIVPVWLSHRDNPDVQVLAYAVLDEQSDASFISDSCLAKLGAPSVDLKLKISTLTGDAIVASKRVDNLIVRGYAENQDVEFSSYTREVIPSKREHISRIKTTKQWPHLQSVASKLMPYRESLPVGLLLGTDCSFALKPVQVVTGGPSDPYAIETVLGWGVVGRMALVNPVERGESSAVGCFKTITRCKEVLTPFTLDEKDRPFSYEDTLFMDLMGSGVRRLDCGRFEAPLPIREPIMLPDNRDGVRQRLLRLKRRFGNDHSLWQVYDQGMKSMIDSGFASEVEGKQLGVENRWYLPHYGINYNTNKKFRIVFDCSAVFKGHSLNQHLIQGPDLSNNLVGVLLRFREEIVAVACDVEKMFFQVSVKPEHRKFLRFLWWKDSDLGKDPVDFEMNVHLFGASSSPSVANFVLKAAAMAGADKDNRSAVEFIKNDFYVDDGLKSVSTVGEAIELVRQSKDICAQAGFNLCKFVSNEPKVLNQLNIEELAYSVRSLSERRSEGEDVIERTLGIQWIVKTDEIGFSVDQKATPSTRRGLLSAIYSVFDPIGLIAPVVLVGKIILQELCRSGVGWDDNIPNDIQSRWTRWRNDLKAFFDWRLPRCYKPAGFGTVVAREFHHFSDASSYGYGQCTYLRQVNESGEVCCALVTAKSRVAPIKITTIPRLELMAALLSAETAVFLSKEMQECGRHYFWTDSKVVLGYLQNDARRFHTFVANRVQQIRDVSTPAQWNFVNTVDNPADVASRGTGTTQLMELDMWWKGPSFLRSSTVYVAERVDETLNEVDPEVRAVTNCVVHAEKMWNIDYRLKKFSSWHAALVGFALCIRSLNRFRRSCKNNDNIQQAHDFVPVSVQEMKTAEAEIVRQTQKHYYGEVYNAGSNRVLPSNALRRLDPFLDEKGLLRVGGRIKHTDFPHSLRHPLVIPKESQCARLIIGKCHAAVKHQGRGFTLGELRSRGYWVVQASSAVASYIYKCVICRRIRGTTIQQKMSDLPKDRLACEPAFTHCGVDVFGPWYVRDGRSEKKRYGVLFTCMSSRAVHIEVAASLSTDSFINAFRRFIARRGSVSTLRSDRGTNLVGAYNELNFNKVQHALRESDCQWIFNPPHASHMGGIWERQIRSVRSIMSVLLSQHGRQLNDECLHTFIVEAEGIINGRPLCAEDLGAETPEPLTPNHLLTGKVKVVLPPPVEFQKGDVYSRKLWKRVQYMVDEFWHRWRKSFLSNLQVRQKWHKTRKNLVEGDIVLVSDGQMPRNRWQLARILETFPDKDGLVRKVRLVMGDSNLDIKGRRVKTLTILERPVHSLVRLLD